MLLEPEARIANPVLTHMPYQHGYTDLTPWPNSYIDAQFTDKSNGRPRRSMLDDVDFYWTKMAAKPDIEEALSKPSNCAINLKKIVASQWNVALEYLWKRLCDFQRRMWNYEEERGGDMKNVLDSLTETLRLVTEWRRRVSWFVDGVQRSL